MESHPPESRRWRWTLGTMMLWVLFLGVGLAVILQAWSRAQSELEAALAAEKQAIRRALADHRSSRATARRAPQQGAIAQSAGYRVAMQPPKAKPNDTPPPEPEPTPETVEPESTPEVSSPPESLRAQLERLKLEQQRLNEQIQRLEAQLQREPTPTQP